MAIDRTFFFEIGGFDEGIELQDAMNTELSMRVSSIDETKRIEIKLN